MITNLLKTAALVFLKKFQIVILLVGMSGTFALSAHAALEDFYEEVNEENYYSVLDFNFDGLYMGYFKFSVEVDAAGAPTRVYFQNGRTKFHADFLRSLPAYQGMSPAEIDAIALRNEGRRLLLGTGYLIQTDNQLDGTSKKTLHLELLSHDPLAAASVRRALDYLGTKLAGLTTDILYLPAPEQRAFVESNAAGFEAAGIRVAKPLLPNKDTCYAGGWAAGYVKRIRAADLPAAMLAGDVSEHDILVMDEAPRDLPPHAALIVSSPSSPSSHPALLAEMSGTPFLFIPGAFESNVWRDLAARRAPLFFKTISSTLRSCTWYSQDGERMGPGAFAKLLDLKRPAQIAQEAFVTGDVAPVNLAVGDVPAVARVGAKAANVARLMRWVPEATVAKAIALPIAAYAKHLETGTTKDGQPLGAFVAAERARLQRPGTSYGEILAGLARIREAIQKSRVAPDLAGVILARYETEFPRASRVRLRSSSNAEDNPQFNGAGIYESFGACVGDDSLPADATVSLCNPNKEPDPILKAIRKVWASLYTDKAFLLRARFGIDEEKVGMGVVSHPSFPNEAANGVMIVRMTKDWRGISYVVESTGFPGEDLSVTNPPVGKIPETMHITDREIEALVRSTEVPTSRTLLTDDQYRELLRIAGVVHAKYEAETPIPGLALDFEWKLLRENGVEKIIVKQVRPVPVPAYGAGAEALGTLIPGATNFRLCPNPAESTKALQRLLYGRPALADIDMHSIPASDALPATIPTPLRKVELQLLTGKVLGEILPDARLTATDWNTTQAESEPVDANTVEQRYVSIANAIRVPGYSENLYLVWNIRQQRRHATTALLGGVAIEPSKTLQTWIQGKLAGEVDQWAMASTLATVDRCELEAFQGTVPEFMTTNVEAGYASNREPPTSSTAVLIAADQTTPSGFRVEITGRSSMQGFDKTAFRHIDRMVVRGLVPRELVITQPHAAVYAPAHHNFSFAWAMDPYTAEGLTAAERASLEARGIRYLVIESQDSMPGTSGGVGILNFDAVGANGRRTRLGQLTTEGSRWP